MLFIEKLFCVRIDLYFHSHTWKGIREGVEGGEGKKGTGEEGCLQGERSEV